MPPFCDRYGGKVLALAINLRQHVTLFTDDDKWEVSENEFPLGADPKLFYTILESYGINGMHHIKLKSRFDGFIGAGLGSSGAASVALITGINKLLGKAIHRERVAKYAWEMEVEKMGWYGGMQDQFIAACGGCNLLEISKDLTRKIVVTPIPRTWVEELTPWMTLFYIGGSRNSRDIQTGFKTISSQQRKALTHLKDLVDTGIGCLMEHNIAKFGNVLDSAWELKKQSNGKVTNARIDMLYNLAKRQGALGGKIMGAGGAGYMMFINPPEKRKNLAAMLAKQGCELIDFSVDWQGAEARIL